jgi:hypothetical protein
MARDKTPKAEITVAPSVAHGVQIMRRHVATAARAEFSGKVQRPRNYAALLSEVWGMAEDLILSVKLSDEPLPRKVGMLRDLTKLLPALDKAESRHRVHIGKRVVQDMTDHDLERAVSELLKRKKDT